MERMIQPVMKKREASFQSAHDFRMRLLPCSPFGEWMNVRQVVTLAKFFQKQVRQRSRRFANNKTRMFAAFEQYDRAAKLARDHGDQRTSEARANHGNVECALHVRDLIRNQR